LNSRPSTTRDILSASTRALLVISGLIVVVAGIAAWRCPDPAPVLEAAVFALGAVAGAFGLQTSAGAASRKFGRPNPCPEPPPEPTP
jgi:cytochrome c oxidase assembly factor CtaG